MSLDKVVASAVHVGENKGFARPHLSGEPTVELTPQGSLALLPGASFFDRGAEGPVA